MVKKNKCYISGPITGVDNFMDNFDRYEYDLTQIFGWTVINPARVNNELPPNTSYSEYMEMSMTMMRMCDRIFMIPGWENSKGAKFERHLAEILGMEIWEENAEGEIHLVLSEGGADSE